MAATTDDIGKIYQQATILDEAVKNGQDTSKLEKVFQEILNGAKGSASCKKLTASFIPRYFALFPALHNKALDTLIDLCEEEDMQIRISAVRSFPLICKSSGEHAAATAAAAAASGDGSAAPVVPSLVPKVADVLGQLLQADVPMELDTVNQALIALLKLSPKDVLGSVFHQIIHRDELQREKAIQFLREKVWPQRTTLVQPWNQEMETFIADNVKKVLEDVSEEEFRFFLSLLVSLSIYKNSKGDLLQILANQAGIQNTQQFQVEDSDNLERFLAVAAMAVSFQQGAPFLGFIASTLLPSFDKLSSDHQLRLVKCVADLAPFATPQDAAALIPHIFAITTKNIPSVEEATSSSTASTSSSSSDASTNDSNENKDSNNNNHNSNGDSSNNENLQFSLIECLLYSLLELGNKAPLVLKQTTGITLLTLPPPTAADSADQAAAEQARVTYADFKKRLLRVDALSDVYSKELNSALGALPADKKATAQVALQTNANIKHFIRAVMSPRLIPTFAKNTHLSWQDHKRKQPEPSTPSTTTAASTAATTAPTSGRETKRPRGGALGGGNQIYVPPARLVAHQMAGAVTPSSSTTATSANSGNEGGKGPVLRYSRGGGFYRGRGGRGRGRGGW